jgi:iron complex transport system substrate-binding protein
MPARAMAMAMAARWAAVLLACAATLGSPGCGPGKPPGTPPPDLVQVEDGFGRSVTTRLPAKRIVSIAPSNTEILFAIGAGPLCVARDDLSDHPAEALALPPIGLTSSTLRREALIALEPDLVLGAEINGLDSVKPIESLGFPVYLLRNPRTFEDLYANIIETGKLTGREAAAREVAAKLEARARAVLDRIAKVEARPTVYYEIDGTDASRPWTVGAGEFPDMLIRSAGGVNLGARFGGSFPRISIENLIRAEPDVLVIGDATRTLRPEDIGRRAGWEGLRAVREGRVHIFDDNLASRPGPRLVEGLERLARILHPGLFPGG